MRTFEELDEEAEKALPFSSIIDPDYKLFTQPGEMIHKIQARCQDWNQPIPGQWVKSPVVLWKVCHWHTS